MLDAIDLIGKTVLYGGTLYNITNVYFVPSAVHNRHYFYFGLQHPNNQSKLNVSYTELLPYLKEQIKL